MREPRFLSFMKFKPKFENSLRKFHRQNKVCSLRTPVFCGTSLQPLLPCFVSILALVIRHANRMFPASYYTVICGLSGCTIFFHIIS